MPGTDYEYLVPGIIHTSRVLYKLFMYWSSIYVQHGFNTSTCIY